MLSRYNETMGKSHATAIQKKEISNGSKAMLTLNTKAPGLSICSTPGEGCSVAVMLMVSADITNLWHCLQMSGFPRQTKHIHGYPVFLCSPQTAPFSQLHQIWSHQGHHAGTPILWCSSAWSPGFPLKWRSCCDSVTCILHAGETSGVMAMPSFCRSCFWACFGYSGLRALHQGNQNWPVVARVSWGSLLKGFCAGRSVKQIFIVKLQKLWWPPKFHLKKLRFIKETFKHIQ